MADLPKDVAATVTYLLAYYSFDLEGRNSDRLVDEWLRQYPADWLRLAVIEALYQGRYKAFSVEQILVLWRRRGKPLPHFNREFEWIVSRQLNQPAHASKRSSVVGEDAGEGDRAELGGNLEGNLGGNLGGNPAVNPASSIQLTELNPLRDPAIFPLEVEPPSIQTFRPVASSAPGLDAFTIHRSGKLNEGLVASQPSIPSILPSASPVPEPIPEFIPLPETSEFYAKLKLVARQGKEPKAK
jgi:hypothetical protein